MMGNITTVNLSEANKMFLENLKSQNQISISLLVNMSVIELRKQRFLKRMNATNDKVKKETLTFFDDFGKEKVSFEIYCDKCQTRNITSIDLPTHNNAMKIICSSCQNALFV